MFFLVGILLAPCGLLLFYNYMQIITFSRCLIISLLILPLSYIYKCFLTLRNKIRFVFVKNFANHDEKVKRIIDQVTRCISNNSFPMCTARPGWENMSPHNALYKKKYYNIKINLYDIIELNVDKKYLWVEPLVTMGQISDLILPLGWTLPVLPELDDLTIGGLINGCGIETTSHIYGLFQEICLEFEIVTASGKLIKCSRNLNSHLFFNIPWSHGTLGFLVSAKIKIIPAKSHVLLEYHPINNGNIEIISQNFSEACKSLDYDFIEGLMYSPTSCVILKGKMANLPTSEPSFIPVNKVNTFHKPWFYMYVSEFLKSAPTTADSDAIGGVVPKGSSSATVATVAKPVYKEYIPLKHYYHRHTKSLFWEIEHLLPFGNHPFFRYLFGWMLPIKVSFLKLTQTESIKRLYEDLHVAQDVLVDVSQLRDTLEFCHREFDLYPIWLCPMKLFYNEGRGYVYAPKRYLINEETQVKMDASRIDDDARASGDDGRLLLRDKLQQQFAMYVDVGLYGMPKSPKFRPRQSLHELERFLIDVNGFEMFYGDVYLTREEFASMMHLDSYEKLREKYALLLSGDSADYGKNEIMDADIRDPNFYLQDDTDCNDHEVAAKPAKEFHYPILEKQHNGENCSNKKRWLLPHVYDKINRKARG